MQISEVISLSVVCITKIKVQNSKYEIFRTTFICMKEKGYLIHVCTKNMCNRNSLSLWKSCNYHDLLLKLHPL